MTSCLFVGSVSLRFAGTQCTHLSPLCAFLLFMHIASARAEIRYHPKSLSNRSVIFFNFTFNKVS